MGKGNYLGGHTVERASVPATTKTTHEWPSSNYADASREGRRESAQRRCHRNKNLDRHMERCTRGYEPWVDRR